MIETLGYYMDLAGVLLIIGGVFLSTSRFAFALWRRKSESYRGYRQDIGRSILLGLEVLVAADIIRTVAVTPTLESVAVLAIIVIIRTFLSMSLEIELEGRVPWRRSESTVVQTLDRR